MKLTDVIAEYNEEVIDTYWLPSTASKKEVIERIGDSIDNLRMVGMSVSVMVLQILLADARNADG